MPGSFACAQADRAIAPSPVSRLGRLGASMDSHILGWVAVLLYLGAEAYAIVLLVRPRAPGFLVPLLIVSGLVLQFADLQLRARALHAVPYGTLGGSMSLFGWMLGLTGLALLFRHGDRAIGPFLIPFIIVFSVIGLLLPFEARLPSGVTMGTLFALH